MAEYLRKYLYKKYGNTMAVYRTIIIADMVQTIFMFIIFGGIFDIFEFIIIGSIILPLLSNFSTRFHCNNLNHCTFLTIIIFSCFGIFTKNVNTYYMNLLVCLLATRYYYNKSPLKVVKENKNEEWHKKTLYMVELSLVMLSLLLYNYNFLLYANCIIGGGKFVLVFAWRK